MATNVVNTGGHLQAQLTRSLERILEDASLSGELKLSGRKLKEFPKTGGKYNLNDTVVADLSKNRFSELPRDVTEFSSLERLDLYHNAIRSLPQSVVQLQTLTYLDLSRNQLTHLPGGLCSLPLKVLRVANNKLSALPMDLPRLGPTLAELDADCNEIASLPPHMGQLVSLRSLRLRRNLLSYLPVEITSLRLVRLDVSENRISVLPVEMRKMTTLVSLDLGDNPLVTPPACLCTRGRVHIFKYLEIQAMKDDKRKGVVTLTPSEEAKIRRPSRKGGILSDLRLTNGLGAPYNVPEDSLGWQKRFTVDSGYGSTGDGIDVKSWAQNPRLGTLSQDAGLTMTVKSKGDQTPPTKPGSLPVSNGGGSAGTCFSGTSTPSTISPGESYMDLEEELIKVRQLEALSEESAVDGRRRKGSGGSGFPSQEQGVGKRTLGHVRFNSNGSNGVNGGSPEHLKSGQSPSSGANSENVDPLRGTQEDVRKPLEHIQTYREYKEALRQQRAGQDGASIYRTRGGISSVDGPQTPGSPVNSSSSNDVFASRVSETQPADDEGLTMTVSSESSSPLRKRGSPSENQNPLSQSPSSYQAKVRNKSSTGSAVNNGNGSIISSQPHMVNGGRGVTNHSSPQHKPAANGAATSPPPYTPPPPLSPPTTSLGAAERISSTGGSNSSPRLVTTSVGYVGGSQGVPGRATLQWPPPPQPPSPTDAPAANIATDPVAMRCRGGRVASVKQQLLWNRDASPHKLTFTMRREFEKAKEEAELIEKMRNSIEVRLKMTLPEDLSPALSDGVVLCHLANHVRPRSVSSIYVPSPAVPKLTMARCRRNVDNFLEACRKIGVEERYICTCDDVVGLGGVDLSPNESGTNLKGGNLLAILECVEQLLALGSPSRGGSPHQNGSMALTGEVNGMHLSDLDISGSKWHQHDLSRSGVGRIWDHFVTILCLSVFVATVLLLYHFPPPD